MKRYKLMLGDCLERMKEIEDASVDLILADLPYGTTACSWDKVIAFKPLWKQYWRIAKPNAAIVLTASQPFTTILINSQIEHFKYEWIWNKAKATGHVHAKNKPMKLHENICVFSKGTTIHAGQSKNRMTYNPQGLVKIKPVTRRKKGANDVFMGDRPSHKQTIQTVSGYPKSIIEISFEHKPVHPTQKPVALMEYLINTYSNKNEVVLDNTMGSGTTGVAALKLKRRFIGIEKDKGYYKIAKKRIKESIAS